jgi:hypothetical protein
MRRVDTPRDEAMARFCITARTFSPGYDRCSPSQSAARAASAMPTMKMRLHGKTRPGRTSGPPRSHVGEFTLVWSPNQSRAHCCRMSPIPQVTMSVSGGGREEAHLGHQRGPMRPPPGTTGRATKVGVDVRRKRGDLLRTRCGPI